MGVRACGRWAGLRGAGVAGAGAAENASCHVPLEFPEEDPRAPVSPAGRDSGHGRLKSQRKGLLLRRPEALVLGAHSGRGTLSLLGGDKGRRSGAGRAGVGGRQSPVLSVAEEARGRPEPQGGSNFQQPNSHQDPGSPERRAGRPRASHRASIPCRHCTVQRRSGASRKKLRTVQISEDNSVWSNL